MGKDVEWFETRPPAQDAESTPPAWHPEPQPPASAPDRDEISPMRSRRRWPYVAAIAAAALTVACVWQNANDEQQQKDRQEKAAAYKGMTGAALNVDGVKAQLVAHWNNDRHRVILQLRSYFDRNAKYLRIDASGKSASSVQENGWFPKDPEIELPVEDPLADVTVRVAIGGKNWKEGMRAFSRTVRLSPTGIAYDAETGKQLPSDL
ncbi:hypothetical protein ACIQFZ_30800 [Streptomyces sp. NPDC093064]|uniref:hypothetical protein n=1 Tax=Streptomyces sp. NPDC093064 TaxID=3366020 RepID=UPI003830F6D4